MNTDLTFITNEQNRNLLERFKVLIKDTEFFDVLVGYFYTSGFYAIYKSADDFFKSFLRKCSTDCWSKGSYSF